MTIRQDMSYCSIGQLSALISVSTVQLRQYQREGFLSAHTLPSGHRRFKISRALEELNLLDAPSESSSSHATYNRCSTAL